MTTDRTISYNSHAFVLFFYHDIRQTDVSPLGSSIHPTTPSSRPSLPPSLPPRAVPPCPALPYPGLSISLLHSTHLLTYLPIHIHPHSYCLHLSHSPSTSHPTLLLSTVLPCFFFFKSYSPPLSHIRFPPPHLASSQPPCAQACHLPSASLFENERGGKKRKKRGHALLAHAPSEKDKGLIHTSSKEPPALGSNPPISTTIINHTFIHCNDSLARSTHFIQNIWPRTPTHLMIHPHPY
ncbi:hypothetical protein IWX47DRAFT_854756 [Phyllosticta citricarpa]